jgi:hypothetical protein
MLLSVSYQTFAVTHTVGNYIMTLEESACGIIFNPCFVKICQLVQKIKRRTQKQHGHLEGLLPSLFSHCVYCLTTGSNIYTASSQKSEIQFFLCKIP